MKLSPPRSLSEIAALIGCPFVGDPEMCVLGINEIHKVEAGDLVFVDHPKYYSKALNSPATFILINKEVEPPQGKALIVSENPFADYNKLTRHFSPAKFSKETFGEHTVVAATAQVHSSATLGNNVTIGERTIVHAGVVIYDHTFIGSDCIVHANTVIGADAFYYKSHSGMRDKMHSCGSVIIENNVEIGALCTIDRGVSAVTRIGAGTKLDNHVHVGHDTVIGKNCLLAAQVGLAGCVTLDDDVILWGQVGVASGVHMGKGAIVMAQSGIKDELEPGKTYFGSPAVESRQKLRELAILRKLPDIVEALRLK